MGNGYSLTNLATDSTSFNAASNATVARWGNAFEVLMSNYKENDRTQVWSVEYKTGLKQRSCGFQLKAIRDGNGVESVYFVLGDSADNRAEFAFKVTRIARVGLSGGITTVDSVNAPISFKRDKKDYTLETTVVSYGCSYREGLIVLETKKKFNSENAHALSLAHYYVTKDVGLSVAAKIHLDKVHGFVVEPDGPFKRPSCVMRKVIIRARRTGLWSHGAKTSSASKSVDSDSSSLSKNKHSDSSSKALLPSVSSSRGLLPSDSSLTGLLPSDSLVKALPSQQNEGKVGQIVKHTFFSSIIKEQTSIGLINSSGYTQGTLNHSIIFIDCNF